MKIGGFLSNDSMFGKVMTKFGTMIVLNILFVISCLPFVTIGPALSALYYSIIEMLRKEEEDMVLGTGGEINPVTVYFKGFRRDFSKCMLYWILFVGIMIMGTINIQICFRAFTEKKLLILIVMENRQDILVVILPIIKLLVTL